LRTQTVPDLKPAPRWAKRHRPEFTAFPGLHLKGEDYASYLDVVKSSDASNDYNDPGYPDGIWKGFKMWSAVGMEMKRLQP
jgi:hypothetical protein